MVNIINIAKGEMRCIDLHRNRLILEFGSSDVLKLKLKED